MTLQNRTLFFGDNLQVIEERFPDNCFDLIYLDPPFNSNRNYNVLFKEGQVDVSAQIRAFEDTWEWTTPTIRLFEELKQSNNPQIAILMQSLFEIMRDTPMMAYLVNMTARLIPLRRVLKDTGSIYLHCDPTASHYLKMIMDVVFDKQNFRNEIVWKRSVPHNDARKFGAQHDIIFYYVKSKKYTWNRIFQPHTANYIENFYKYADEDGRKYQLTSTTAPGGRGPLYSFLGVTRNWRYTEENMKKLYSEGKIIQTKPGTVPRYKRYLDEQEGVVLQDVWADLQPLQANSSELLGYPTQKPEALLERIVRASSNKGDWILDPFCGCGTTIAVAEQLHRNWVGIDISMQAVNVIRERMKSHFPGIKIAIDGIPMDYASAAALAEKDKFAFQDWAITLVGANPPSGTSKKGADRGVDGIILFREKVDYLNPKLRKIIVQVKGGSTNRGDVAKLKGDLEREDAPLGILITLKDATAEMRREAALSGEYQYTEATTFPRIQLLSIREWFEGKELRLPADTVNPFKKAEAKKGDEGGQLGLLD